MLAKTVSLDMADRWEPSDDRCLNRVPKAGIIAAVSEEASPEAAESIASMKKDAMAGGLRFCSEVPLRFDDSAVNESEAVWDDAGERAAQREERPFFQVLRRDR